MSAAGKSSTRGRRDHAKVDQPQTAAALKDHVVRLDVAVDDAGPVQGRYGLGEPGGDPDALAEVEARLAPKPPFQRFALVERHDRVEAGLTLGRHLDHFADPRVMDARRHPGLAHEGEMVRLLRRDGGLGELDDDVSVAVRRIDRLEQPAVAPFGQDAVQPETIDRLTRLGRRVADGQGADGRGEIGMLDGGQGYDIDHHGRHVVGAAGLKGACDDLLRRFLRGRAAQQQVADAALSQHAMDAVGAQQEPVMGPQRLGHVVETDERLDPDRPVTARG